MRIFLFLPLFCLFSWEAVLAAKQADDGASFHFVENKGQWQSEIKYKTEIPNGALFLTDKGLVYNFIKEEDVLRINKKKHQEGADLSGEMIHYHAYRVQFEGANKSISYQEESRRSHYHNYFLGNDRSKWVGNVSVFGKIIQEEVYDGIDLAIYSSGHSLKYDFVVSPNSDPSQIVLSFEGVSPQLDGEGNLLLKTSVNSVLERAPYSYQVVNGKKVTVESHYSLNDGKLSFSFPNGYNAGHPLVIDPDLIFATFSGATSTNAYAYATTYDRFGNMYVGADAWSVGWPTTMGAAQVAYGGGGHEVAINKYNPNGTALVYSTHFGGGNWDLPHAMRVNQWDELVVVGSTQSVDLPTTVNCLKDTIGGTWDMFVVRFNALGTAMLGSTYIGGSGIEPLQFTMTTTAVTSSNLASVTSPMELDFDRNGNIWVVGNTNSNDFPLTSNAYQSALSGGIDGVVFQLDPACSQLLYSSYLGGSGNDGPSSIAIDKRGNIVIGGITNSSNFPTTPGVLHPNAPGGSYDGFLTVMDTRGNIINSSYIGTSATDHVVALQIDHNNDIYILGRTTGNYPISAGVWTAFIDGDCFIDKIRPDLSASLLSTRLGNPQPAARFFPSTLMVDNCDKVYVAGFSAANNLPLTSNAYQSTAAAFWFCVLEPDFSGLHYASYFGASGDHNHIGVNRMDPLGIVYHSICKSSAFANMPPGVWSPTKTAKAQDVLSFKFDFGADGLRALIGLQSGSKDSICAPGRIDFLNLSTSPYKMDFVWDFGDGTTDTATNPSHTYTLPGVYNVVLHARSDSACNKDAYDSLKITVFEVKQPLIRSSDTLICKDGPVELSIEIDNFNANQRIEWGPTSSILSGENTIRPTVDPSTSDVFYVKVVDSIHGICGFVSFDTIRLEYAPGFLHVLTPDTAVCEGAEIILDSRTSSGYSLKWSPARNLDDPTSSKPKLNAKQSGTYTLTVSYPGCPDLVDSVKISVDSLPRIFVDNIEQCPGLDSIDVFVRMGTDRSYSSLWTPADYLRDPSALSNRFYANSGVYHYTLLVKTPDLGCTASKPVTITVHEPLDIDVSPADTLIRSGKSFFPEVDGDASEWDWSPPDFVSNSRLRSPLLSPKSDMTFTVQAMDENGCRDSATINVKIEYRSGMFLPNAFSPNGDQLNDVFFLQNFSDETLLSFKIFNRYGELVFETTDLHEGWDGTIAGKPAEMGVYFYVVHARMPTSEIVTLKGDVTLVR